MRFGFELRRRCLDALPVALLAQCAGALAVEKAGGGRPERSIRIAIPVAHVAGSDRVARLVGKMLTERIGRYAIVASRSGGSGMIAGEIAAKVDQDGCTHHRNGFVLLMPRTGTPAPIMDFLDRTVSAGMNTPEMTQLLQSDGSAPGKPRPWAEPRKPVAAEHAEVLGAVQGLLLKF